MDAQPELALLAKVLNEEHLEAVVIGNMAAALHGAPVTTLDVDFLFRKTPGNLKKLKAVANRLGARIMRPYYPLSDLFQLQRDQDALQVDFMGHIDGIKSYESLRSRAKHVEIGGHSLLVADLRDIIASKRAAGRPKDKAVLDILKVTLDEEERASPRPQRRPQTGK